jgi:hypothetical protein
MTQQEKIEKLEKLFDEIRTLFGRDSVSLSVHGINMDGLDDSWDISGSMIEDSRRRFWSAKKKTVEADYLGITLFE